MVDVAFEAKEAGQKTVDALDVAFIDDQISLIKESIPNEHQWPVLLMVLERLKSYAMDVYEEALYYPASLKNAARRLDAIDWRAEEILANVHRRILESLKQYTVSGIISFLETDIFPQEATYRKLIDEAVAMYCLENK